MKTLSGLSVILIVTLHCLTICCNRNDRLKIIPGSPGYFVSPSGSDSNPGTRDEPWMSIEKVNTVDLDPGDTVFFQGNQVFSGTLKLDTLDAGNADTNIVITSYGEGKAKINGGKSSAIQGIGCDHILIRDLEFKADGRKEGNVTDGVMIMNSNFVNIDQVEVHGFQHSGLHLYKCNDSRIIHVYAHDNGFAGIHVTGSTMNDPVNYDNHNVYIGYCVAENNPGDPTVLKSHSGNGILASSVDGGIIEYCEAFNNGWDMPWNGNGPVGIWVWDCTNFTIQHCISHDNKTRPGARDGGGFDLDGGVSNSVIQYCLSYNNQGIGIGLYEFGATKPWENNTIRFNISQDDGKTHDGSLGIWKAAGGTMRNCNIYNNTFYNSNPEGNIIWLDSSMPGFKFYNNIFIYTSNFLYKGNHFIHERFLGNVYWNLAGGFALEGYDSIEEWGKATGNEMIGGTVIGKVTDPMLVNPGKVTLTRPGEIQEKLSEYKLKPGSPLIDNGLDLDDKFGIKTGDMDFLGTKIPQGNAYDIGAVEFVK